MKEVTILALILMSLLIISGVDECVQGGGIGIGGQTQAARYGVDFILEQGLDKITEGKEVVQGDSFFIDVLIENFDSEPKSGQICIADDIDSVYSGIPSLCRSFNIAGATYISGALESPATLNLAFPESGYYKYEGLPSDINAKLYVTISYVQHSVMAGSISAPEPAVENAIQLKQEPAPIAVSVDKSISAREANLNANLKFTLTSQGNFNITSTDFKSNSIIFTPKLSVYQIDCPELQQNAIAFKSTKFISCSAFLPREQLAHPLVLTLDYGVKLSKEFNFKIKKA